MKRTLTPEQKESKGLLPLSTSNVTDRADDWFNEDTLSETHSYNVGSNVVEEVTPEEVRSVFTITCHPPPPMCHLGRVLLKASPFFFNINQCVI